MKKTCTNQGKWLLATLFPLGYLLLFMVISAPLCAQNITVSGVVTDSNKDAAIGANVLLKGTSTGTIVDLSGKYQLTVPQNGILVFSSVGFVTREVAVNNRRTINVTLADDVKLIDEVVVVGYGTVKKSDLTGSVGKVTTTELTQLSTTDVGQAIAGRVAGVDVISNSGAPGAGTKIRVRGYGTINSSDPLYVVDGFPVSDIDYLSTQDIESLEILKDASATAIYGSRGANGVVLIKTKGGHFNTKTSINATVYASMSKMYKDVNLLNAWEFATLKKELAVNSGTTLSDRDEAMFDYVIDHKYEGTDWTDEVSRIGYAKNYNLDISGGTDRQTYSVGATYSTQQGTLKYNAMDIITGRVNNTYKLPLGLTLGINVIYSRRVSKGGNGDGNYFGSIWPSVMRADPIIPAWDEYTNNWGEVLFSDPSYDPARSIYLNSDKWSDSSSDMLIGNFSLQMDDIANVKGLAFRTQYGVRANYSSTKKYTPVWYVSSNQSNSNSSLSVGRNNFASWLWNGYLMYNKMFGQHSVNSTLGAEAQDFRYTILSGSASDVPENPNLWYIDNSLTASSKSASNSMPFVSRMASFFGRVNYAYASKYLLTVTGRYDGSSKFADAKKWGFFPSFSVGWNAHEESFLKGKTPFDQLKLRAGWGQVGNENSASGFGYISLMNSGFNAVIGDLLQQGQIQQTFANSELAWETAEQVNFGLDFGLLNMRLSGTIDYFVRTTNDMILRTPIPLYAGMGRANTNAGSMRNNGLELTLRWNDRIGKDFSYSISGNASFVKNKVLALGSPDPIYGVGVGRKQESFTRTEVGREMAYFYGYKTDGIFQNWDEINNYKTPDGQLIQPKAAPGDVKFLKTANDGLPLNPEDRTYLGSGMPDATFGLNLTANYKGFDLALFLQSSVGNELANALVMDIYSSEFGQWNMSKDMMNRWHGEGTTNIYPRLIASDPNENSRFSDRYVENGSYLRMKNLQIGYTLPATFTQKFKVSRLRIYGSIDNVFVLTKYSGFDPELGDYISNPLNNGVDLASYPRPRTFVLGFNISL
ncbi:TonB-dependent receptor [uncultured Bacteroides sp.]|uniref:SusC/RagA family TonB-linked outer membrane protein n=1 Tax=uncultured Bacteroides sp. TaxID=162156 RepID=UPI002AA606C2|nr:TonB-dependent receptor [uncultured Bacteroides sp.]